MSTLESPIDDRIRLSVLDAADVLFERYGYRKTTVEEIAQEAGIGKGSIYLHFKSKEEIALHWLKRLHEGVFEKLTSVGTDPTLAIPARLRSLLIARVMVRFDIFDRHRRSMDEVLDSLQACLREKREVFHAREAELLRSIIEKGLETGEIVSAQPQVDAESMVLATNALCPYNIRTSHLGERAQVEEKVSRLASLLVRGIQKGKSE